MIFVNKWFSTFLLSVFDGFSSDIFPISALKQHFLGHLTYFLTFLHYFNR